jgi:hypothetical protein
MKEILQLIVEHLVTKPEAIQPVIFLGQTPRTLPWVAHV